MATPDNELYLHLSSQRDDVWCAIWFRFSALLGASQMDTLHSSPGSWLQFEPGMDHGEDGEDGGGQAAGPNKAWSRGVNPQPIQWNEDITTVLQQVQQQWRIVVENSSQQVKLRAEPGWGDGEGRRGGGREIVSLQGVADIQWRLGFGGVVAGLALHEETELIDITSQVENQSK